MIGILVQLIISWLIIYFAEKRDLSVLGWMPTRRRLAWSGYCFLLTAFCCAAGFFLRMYFVQEQWMLNPRLSAMDLLNGTWWNIKSVIFEELIFRGVLLYLLIKKFGATWGIVISSIAFGIYHWFSHEVIGNPVQMLITFVTTGLMGAVYAYGYARSRSVLVPSAIHLGWNLTMSVVFSSGNIGDQLFVQVKPVPQVTVSYLVYFCILLLPMASAMVLNFLLLRKMPVALKDRNVIPT